MTVRRINRAARWAVWLARFMVLAMLIWQGVLVELVESHDDMGHCEDDEGADCPCAPNCHCCLDCAHHGSPALPFALAAGADRILDFVELGEFVETVALESTERGPPLKVPKQAPARSV